MTDDEQALVDQLYALVAVNARVAMSHTWAHP